MKTLFNFPVKVPDHIAVFNSWIDGFLKSTSNTSFAPRPTTCYRMLISTSNPAYFTTTASSRVGSESSYRYLRNRAPDSSDHETGTNYESLLAAWTQRFIKSYLCGRARVMSITALAELFILSVSLSATIDKCGTAFHAHVLSIGWFWWKKLERTRSQQLRAARFVQVTDHILSSCALIRVVVNGGEFGWIKIVPFAHSLPMIMSGH